MELVPGRHLRLAARSSATLDDRMRWLVDVARGLDAAHRAGLVHRDVKPQNVLVAGSIAKLLDFGIAKEIDDAARGRTALLPALKTQPGFSLGTPQYMAPEVLRGEHASDARSDQFAWGLVAFEVLTGAPAARDDLEYGSSWLAPRISATGLSERTAAILERALAPDRDQRFSSMGDLADALEASRDPLPRTVEQAQKGQPSKRPETIAQGERCAQPTRLFPVWTPDDAGPKPDAASSAQQKAAAPAATIREPKAAILKPLVDRARAELDQAVPGGLERAVVIVTLDVEKGRARFFVQLVATDASGELWTPDASMDLVTVAGAAIANDARDGNGRWQRLVLRVQRHSSTATIQEVG
jgi:serine/threonine protein kinase